MAVFLVIMGHNNNNSNFCLSGHPGKSESYLDAIRKNIEWLKKHNKEGNKEGKCSLNTTYYTAAEMDRECAVLALHLIMSQAGRICGVPFV